MTFELLFQYLVFILLESITATSIVVVYFGMSCIHFQLCVSIFLWQQVFDARRNKIQIQLAEILASREMRYNYAEYPCD